MSRTTAKTRKVSNPLAYRLVKTGNRCYDLMMKNTEGERVRIAEVFEAEPNCWANSLTNRPYWNRQDAARGAYLAATTTMSPNHYLA